MNAIIGFSELMQRELFGSLGSSHYKSYAGDINKSGTHLLALVDDILDLSRIEAGTQDLKEGLVSLRDEINAAINLLQIQAEQKHIVCLIEGPLAVPMIRADARKVRQIFINLINNAIKFSIEEATVRVRIRIGEDGVSAEVIDTGTGMKAEDIQLALTPFGRAERMNPREKTGVGIGLPLSAALMQLHGGKLTIESDLGKGTCVRVWFPAERVLSEPTH